MKTFQTILAALVCAMVATSPVVAQTTPAPTAVASTTAQTTPAPTAVASTTAQTTPVPTHMDDMPHSDTEVTPSPSSINGSMDETMSPTSTPPTGAENGAVPIDNGYKAFVTCGVVMAAAMWAL